MVGMMVVLEKLIYHKVREQQVFHSFHLYTLYISPIYTFEATALQ